MFRGTQHWALSSVDESTLQRRFNASGIWSYATECVVATKFKNCSALQTSLTAHPSTHHHLPEDWIPSSTTVITSNLPLHTHSFTMQHCWYYPSTYASVSEEVFPSGLFTSILYEFLIIYMHATWHSHCILTDMTYWNITDEVIQYEDSPLLASKHYLSIFSLVTSNTHIT